MLPQEEAALRRAVYDAYELRGNPYYRDALEHVVDVMQKINYWRETRALLR